MIIKVTNLTLDYVSLPGLGWMILPGASESQEVSEDILIGISDGGLALQALIDESRIEIEIDGVSGAGVLSGVPRTQADRPCDWILSEDLCLLFSENLDTVIGDLDVE